VALTSALRDAVAAVLTEGSARVRDAAEESSGPLVVTLIASLSVVNGDELDVRCRQAVLVSFMSCNAAIGFEGAVPASIERLSVSPDGPEDDEEVDEVEEIGADEDGVGLLEIGPWSAKFDGPPIGTAWDEDSAAVVLVPSFPFRLSASRRRRSS